MMKSVSKERKRKRLFARRLYHWKAFYYRVNLFPMIADNLSVSHLKRWNFKSSSKLERYRQHELARQRLAAIKHIRFLFDSLDSNNEDQMFCGLKKILECEKERLRSMRSSDSGLSPFGSLRKYMKSNKTSCPTLNALSRDSRTCAVWLALSDQLTYLPDSEIRSRTSLSWYFWRQFTIVPI